MSAGAPPIRTEIIDAHGRLLAHWASAGAWWSGEERTAIVEEVRRARTNPEIGPLQSAPPSGSEGQANTVLADGVVDVIWRITNHPGTLSRSWFDTVVTTIDPLAYVELVAVVSMANALEIFHRGLGLEPAELAPAVDGAPSNAAPPGVEVESHWTPTTAFDGPNIRRALSAVPLELAMQGAILDAQYVPGGAMAVELTESVWSLDRTQMELVATRTSTLNECFY